MEQLSAKAKELGANTKFSATEASEAFSYMAKFKMASQLEMARKTKWVKIGKLSIYNIC